jgi:hypothetical protein
MDGYTRWISDDDDVNDGAAGGNEEGHEQDNNSEGGREDEESPRHDHEDEDIGADHEDEDARADIDGSSLGWVRDPHVQALLLKQSSSARAAAREKAKLVQLETDAITPLYEGCRMGIPA